MNPLTVSTLAVGLTMALWTGGAWTIGTNTVAAQAGGDWQEVSYGESFPIGELNPQHKWVSNPVDAERWRPVDQPDLADQLAAAGELEFERVAPPPERAWVGNTPYVVPAPDGESWQMIYPYFNGYGGEQEVIIHDFATGETTRQYFGTDDAEMGRGIRVDFHMQPAYYTHGKLIIEMYGALAFMVYDPAERRFVHAVKPFGDDVIQGKAVLGEDGMIYGMGWPRDRSGFVAYRFDPETYETHRWETFGPANPYRKELYRQITMSGDWIYAGIGNRPWHLVGFNVRTGEGRVLATTEDVHGSHRTIGLTLMEGGVAARIQEAAEIADLDQFDREEARVWLHDGRVYPRDGDTPPWADEPAQRSDRQLHWGRGTNTWSGLDIPAPVPQFREDTHKPAPGGHVELQYRFDSDEPWRTLAYQVRMYTGTVARVLELSPDVVFAIDSGYGEHVFYNLRTGQLRRVEGTLSTYSMNVFRDRLYVSGYSNSVVYEYDFTRELGRQQDEPNPQMVALMGRYNQTHYTLAGTHGAADGRVYTAGDSSGRQRIGGGYGWYDTETGEVGGEPIDGHRFFWGTTASDGRYLLWSSKHADGGELWAWDTQTEQFIYKQRMPFDADPGAIVEAMPGLVIGHAKNPQGEGGILYGLVPETGEVLWTKPVPAGPVTAFGQVRRHNYEYRRGPDGHIWTFFGNTLVRIDPRNVQVEPVGQVDGPAQIAFAADGIFIAGANALRRIANVTVPSQ